ncbi:MAG: DUF3793 family protein [Lachnospiraceae bacterium]|nr:DUF3793 family protein [Lachnospiraceae bacterium]
MSEELLVKHCSPTLAGIKTGNLFTCEYNDEKKLRECIRCWNRTLTKKGVRAVPLRFWERRALIYVYRPSRLDADFRHGMSEQLLQERGYCKEKPGNCVVHLIKRLHEYEMFPHEIGLFLGYPPEDVSGFIENHADGYKWVGSWKVYGNEEAAKKTCARYKKCTEVYRNLFAEGKTIEQLTEAAR